MAERDDSPFDGYYWNSLRAWKRALQDKHRRLMSRYDTMVRTGHPSHYGQGKLIELNAAAITMIDAALLGAPSSKSDSVTK